MQDANNPITHISCLSLADVLTCCNDAGFINIDKLYELVKSKTGV